MRKINYYSTKTDMFDFSGVSFESYGGYVKNKAAEYGLTYTIRKYWKHAVISIGFGLILIHLHA